MNSDLLGFYNYHGVYEGFSTDRSYSLEDGETISENTRYSALWGAVILQAMIDITSNYKRTENNLEKTKAYNWISDMHSDFITVCHFAGYNPIYVRNKMRSMLSRSQKKRK
ncbi:hypothetical protein [Candidatus Anaplasma sp. TIGMIC]|uniref:hypothetical protein n=1 Tax=Candidatus Anaplasma sp. TIGMIC TaxID=3020713 RepID=UPI00232B4AD6|nr:hypothetical protein [Candidatus Anaplasma sp. TIGMIC]MDB1135203.1 hypothetical protein [Candidatus Anaplasma sp. TIGMIC]